MKKSAKNTQSKRTRQRKLIQIKESRHISPVKQVTQPQDSKIFTINQKVQKIPPLTKQEYQFPNSELEQISSHADALVSVQLKKKIIQKQLAGIQNNFLANSPPIMQKALGKAIKKAYSNFNIIREQRVERMKQDTVIFIPPDRDNFQKRKGKILNNWIKQQLSNHEKKNKFGKNSENYMEIFKNTEEKITNLTSLVPQQKIQPEIQRITCQISKQNNTELQSKLSNVCFQLRDVLKLAGQMGKTRAKAFKEKQKTLMRKQYSTSQYSSEKIPTHSMTLCGIQDYFF